MLHFDNAIFRYGFGTRQNTPADLQIHLPTQTHSTHIYYLNDRASMKLPEADGVITSLKQASIGVITADCVPIIYADPVNRIIGVSHQGWKGTYDNMPGQMVSGMVKQGASLAHIRVSIGPSIGACCYRIYGDRYEMFRNTFSRFQADIFVRQFDDMFLNLARLNMLLLIEAGIAREHIEFLISCTKCSEEMYYSYQRDGRGSGHMISYIMMV